MSGKMQMNYKFSGSGVLTVDGDAIYISVPDKGDYNLARLLSDLDGCAVKFSFSYDEDYEAVEETEDN